MPAWNEDLLAGELEYLLTQSEDIEIDVTGFSIAEVDQLVDIGGTDQSAESAEDDRVPEIKREAVTRHGDVWILGRSRLVCGDAREEHTYVQLMTLPGGELEQADMVFTDPPYNVPIEGHVAGKRRGHHREFAMASGEMSADVPDPQNASRTSPPGRDVSLRASATKATGFTVGCIARASRDSRVGDVIPR
jgi:hypothetical protein